MVHRQGDRGRGRGGRGGGRSGERGHGRAAGRGDPHGRDGGHGRGRDGGQGRGRDGGRGRGRDDAQGPSGLGGGAGNVFGSSDRSELCLSAVRVHTGNSGQCYTPAWWLLLCQGGLAGAARRQVASTRRWTCRRATSPGLACSSRALSQWAARSTTQCARTTSSGRCSWQRRSRRLLEREVADRAMISSCGSVAEQFALAYATSAFTARADYIIGVNRCWPCCGARCKKTSSKFCIGVTMVTRQHD